MTSAVGCVNTTTRTPTPSTTTPCAPGENCPQAPPYWLAALPRPSYEQECAGLQARAQLRRGVALGTVPDTVAERHFLHDPLSDDPIN